ncbi:MAG: undecaprenyl-diphosphate phosphatase [Bacteroidetes bacterium]|nr:undecaprenyl-diphosphate phosphatase [Bacteroidota bacterium]
MNGLEALLLGLVQGLTEFLPVSSSGHLVMGKAIFGIETQGVAFEIAVHAATVLSILTVFRKDIGRLLKSCVSFKVNEDTRYLLMLLLSMVPVLVVGLFFKTQVEALFGNGLALVGAMLLLTAIVLIIAQRAPSTGIPLKYRDAFVMGLAQAIAVLPGLSRSGATISTGLILGKERSAVVRFSFLMVIVPILGQAFLDVVKGGFAPHDSGIPLTSLVIGFAAAYLSGLAACSWMIALVRKAKLWGFIIYCALAGSFCLLYHFTGLHV